MEQKVKNEGRVAWGKKLAQMSKEAKEKKKNESSTEKSEDSKPQASESSKEKSENITYLLLTAGGVFLVYMLYNKPKVPAISILKVPSLKKVESVEPVKVEPVKAQPCGCYDYRTF